MHHSQLCSTFKLAKPIGQESYEKSVLTQLEIAGALIGTRKRDGHKMIAEVGRDQTIRLYTSGMHEIDHRLNYIREEIRSLRLREGTVLVGELVIERTTDGRTHDDMPSVHALLESSFKNAQKLLATGSIPQFFVFNALYDEPHHDLESWPYRTTLDWLQKKLRNGNYVVPVDEVTGTLEAMKKQAFDSGWEGLVLYDTAYRLTWRTEGLEPRPKGCYKFKPVNEDDFFIFSSWRRFRSDGLVKDVRLLQWEYRDATCTAAHFIDCGRLGAFDDMTRGELTASGWTNRVLQVRFVSRYPKTGKLREPAFVRFRDDKKMQECIAPKTWPHPQSA